jgi:hypothetical protein
MNPEKVNYNSLRSDYANSGTLMYKKNRLVNTYIHYEGKFRDIGIGTEELVLLRKGKHEQIDRLDFDETSLRICKEKFEARFTIKNVQSVEFPLIHSEFLRKHCIYLENVV